MSLTRKCFGREFLPGVLYEMVKECIGGKSIKCVVDGKDCVFTCDMETLLSSLSIEHPVGEIIIQSLKSHKEQFGEGVRSYLFMISSITKAVSQLQDVGIQSGVSLTLIQEVIDHLSHQVRQISVAVKLSSDTGFKDEPASHSNHTGVEHESELPSCDGSLFGPGNSDIFTGTPLVGRSTDDHFDGKEVCVDNVSSGCLYLHKESQPSQKTKNIAEKSKNVQSLDLGFSESGLLKSHHDDEQKTESFQLLFDSGFSKTDYHKMDSNEVSQSAEVVECDPVVLKMSHFPNDDENEFDDIEWYFDKSVSEDKSRKEKLRNQNPVGSEGNDLEIIDSVRNLDFGISHDLKQTGRVLHKEPKVTNHGDGNDETKGNDASTLRDANQHDSDFEDCFDDLENRKQVEVVVERIEDINKRISFSDVFQNKNDVMKRRMDSNIQKHFTAAEFETVLAVPSLDDSKFDNDFNDSFDDGEINQCRKGTSVIAEKPKLVTSQERKVIAVNQQLASYVGESILNANNVSRSKHNQSSELERLNSILSSVSSRKSHAMKEILISSRHNLEESIPPQPTESSDMKVDHDAKDKSSSSQDEIHLVSTVHNGEGGLNLLHTSSCELRSDVIDITEREEKADLELFVNPSSSIPSLNSRHKELSKLNTVLSSMNLKTSSINKKQIFISSRHDLKDETMPVKSPLDNFSDEIVTGLPAKEITHENHKIVNDSSSRDFSSGKPSCKQSVPGQTLPKTCYNEAKNLSQIQKSSAENAAIQFGTHNIEVTRQLLINTETSHHGNGFYQNRKSPQTSLQVPCALPQDLCTLARGQEDLVGLFETLLDESLSLGDNNGRNGLPLHLTSCVSIQTTKSDKAVIRGLAIPCQRRHLDGLSSQFGFPLKALLVNGDLTPNHRHKGYKPTAAKKTLIKSSADVGSQKKEVLWASRIVETMKELQVLVVLVRGTTTDVMSDVCLAAGVTLLTNMPYHAMNIVSRHMRIEMLCYAGDAVMSNVCELLLKPLNPAWMDAVGEEHCLVLSNLGHVKSIVISEPCALAAQISEEKFWKCFHRISNSLSDGLVLPGGGATESWCQEQILQMVSSSTGPECQGCDQQLLRVTVLESLAQVFQDFATTVRRNVEKESTESVEPRQRQCQTQEHEPKCRIPGMTEHYSNPQEWIDDRKNVFKDCENYSQASYFDVDPAKTIVRDDFCCQSRTESQYSPTSLTDGVHHHCDTLSCKLSIWRSAVDVVSVLSSLDSLVITGASDSDRNTDSVLL